MPYTVYGTGVLYRADRVSEVPENGYDLLWDEQYAGKTYLLDDYGEAIGMSLLRNDITTDINTSNPDYVKQATDSLIELIDLVKIKANVNAYSEVPEGTATVHQAWSGDLIAGQYYLPKGETPEVLAYWRPEDPARTSHRQRRHRDPEECREAGAGARDDQRPARQRRSRCRTSAGTATSRRSPSCPPRYLIDQGYIPENLMDAVVVPGDFDDGLTFYEVSPETEALWRNNWSRFKAGA